MAIEVKVPLLPESISDATVSTWHKKAGDRVSRDENLVDLETDKVMLEVPAPSDGILKQIIKPSGQVVQANQVIAIVEAGAAKPVAQQAPQAAAKPAAQQAPQAATKTETKTTTAAGPAARRVAAEHD